ncbi:FkbM family methyltransferase [Pseudorhizobium marinum]|uniref:FkbM family methyltransferase n=1 Tax=Pseudorhizobium marinum TaxID=1496690 RepID=UPI000495BD43|nr:FkbM family methyltransferase [Pseudorhizobium marinum]
MELHEFLGISSPIEIVDIGASLAEEPIYKNILTEGYGRVTGFEPNPAEIEKLNAQKKDYETYLPYFIGTGLDATFYETNWALTGSLFEPNEKLLNKFSNLGEATTLVQKHSVQTHRLNNVSEITDIDLLKMDIQGSELNALRNGTEKLRHALVVQVEVEFVELYKGQPLFADVDIFLRHHGFQFHTFSGFGMRSFKPIVVDGNANVGLRQSIWSDAIYVRDWMDLSQVADEKLKKYAFIMHSCYGSYDLAHLVLSHLDTTVGSDYAPRYLAMITAGER